MFRGSFEAALYVVRYSRRCIEKRQTMTELRRLTHGEKILFMAKGINRPRMKSWRRPWRLTPPQPGQARPPSPPPPDKPRQNRPFLAGLEFCGGK
jgi:hypothetical protein